MDNIGNECVICKEPLWQNPATEPGQVSSAFNQEVRVTDVVKLTCKHRFHSDCIERWVVKNPRCPLDRYSITTLPSKSINNLHRILLKSIEDDQIDDVRGILSTGLLDPGQLSSLDQKNPLTVSLEHKRWEISGELVRVGVTTQDRGAQNTLGRMYEKGLGVEQNDGEALFWYLKAADQGHAIAQYNVGSMYECGLGVRQDIQEALAWYHKAADQGYGPAQNKVLMICPNFPGWWG